MSKNNHPSLALLMALLISGSAFAQAVKGPLLGSANASAISAEAPAPVHAKPAFKTVDDLLRSGKLGGNTYSLASIMPSDVSSKPTPAVEEPHIPALRTSNPSLMLTGIFQSRDTNRAEIEALGTRRTYVVGEHVQGGWTVSAITGQTVEMSRCVNKKCGAQTLRLGD
jgi:hypothetical protein